MQSFLEAVFPFLWIVLRTSGLLATCPVIGTNFVPWTVKVAIALSCGYILWPQVPISPVPQSIVAMGVRAVGEVLFGMALGFMGSIIMGSIELSGHLDDMEIGFGLSNVIDPYYGQASPLIGIFKYLLITLIFMGLNGHHLFIKALYESFTLMPAGAAFVPLSWSQLSVAAAAQMMKIAICLSAPVWVSLLIVDIALGFVARSVPQINVFVVGMPLKTIMGILVLSASIGFYGVFGNQLTLTMKGLLEGLLGKGGL